MELKNISHISIDICTRCQLKCISCSTSRGLIRDGYIKEGYMKFESFKQILEENPTIKDIELSNWGEIFLNPDLLKMLEYAYKNDITLYCANGSNFNYVKDSVLEGLVKYQFKYLNLSIDGATEDTYVQYRRNGHFQNVITNINKLIAYKKRYTSEYPKLSWQFIIFGHNEHEIPRVKQLCEELGMAFNPKMNHSEFSPIKDPEFIKKETGLDYASRQEYKQIYKNEYKHPCYQCLFSPQINWNGEVLGCCVNKWKGLGNIYNRTLSEIIDSQTYRFMIDVLFGRKEPDVTIPCYYCPNIEKIKVSPLTKVGLENYSNYVPKALQQ